MSERMRQIADARAPFPDIDRAIAAGHELARRESWSISGIVAEPQPGGYFCRLTYTVATGGGRQSRHRRQAHTVEIGKIDGPAFHPLNRTDLSGKPYFCHCGSRFPEDCERTDCGWEDDRVAQERLIAAHGAQGTEGGLAS